LAWHHGVDPPGSVASGRSYLVIPRARSACDKV